MSNFTFRPAKRENVGLMIGLSGGTGSGKTRSAMRLAHGIMLELLKMKLTKKDRFALIDTENRRALHYASDFPFDHGDLRAPFRPGAYIDAIMAADEQGYSVIVVDSVSHVWAGDGGVLDWQEEELDKMAGDDWKKREANRMRSFIKPKVSHKKMISKLLQVNAHIIPCMRAEPKVEMRKVDGKMKVVPKEGPTGFNGWMPVCEKNFPFEMTASFMLMAEKPGIPNPIKLQEQHKAIFPSGKLIDEDCGRRLAQWAAGGEAPRHEPKPTSRTDQVREWMTCHRLDAKSMVALCRSEFGERIKSSKDLSDEDFKRLTAAFDAVEHGSCTLEQPEDGPPIFVPTETIGSGEGDF